MESYLDPRAFTEFNLDVVKSSLVATQHYDALKDTIEKHQDVGSFMQMIFTVATYTDAYRRASELLPETQRHLEWTNQNGALLGVFMQQDAVESQPPVVQSVRFLGGGATPLDVVSKDLLVSDITAPDTGYRYVPESSFLIWITKEGEDFQWYIVPPGSLPAIIATAVERNADKEVMKASAETANQLQLIGLVNRLEKEELDDKVKKELDNARDARAAALQERKRIEFELAENLQEQQRISGARAWIDSLSTVLSVAELGLQLSAMLGNQRDSALSDRIGKASTPEELEHVAETYSLTLSNEQKFQQDQYEVLIREIKSYQITITEQARTHGAPDSATQMQSVP